MHNKWTLTGKIVGGVKQGAYFTRLDWFQEQCLKNLGFRPYPGTLNLEISTDDISKIEALEKQNGVEFIPPDSTFCSGKAYPITVEGVGGAVIMPAKEVRVHGKNIVEVIAPLKLKETLNATDGDTITLMGEAPLPPESDDHSTTSQ